MLCGGCQCGQVRYEATGDPGSVCFCHCESCRRAIGAAPVAWATFDSARFALAKGTLAEHRSSTDVVRGFCGTCGTSITYRNAGRPDEVDVTLVTLDDPLALEPGYHIWVEDKVAWVVIGDGKPQYATVRGRP